MSQKRLYPHTDLHPHAHAHRQADDHHEQHDHQHEHPHPHRHATSPPLSRRGALRAGLALAGGGLLARLLGKLGLPVAGAATDPKQIYLAPDDHTDYIWSAGETTYRDAFLEMIDWYLDQADADIAASTPAPYHSRWNCDGSFWIWTYERNKSPAAFDRLIARIRDGHISVPLNALCICEGGAPVEAVLRGMYYPGRLERRYNLRFRLAYAIENQTLPFGLGALWAGAGAKYSWKGICGCATQVPNAGDREHEVYWWVGPDGSRILMKWNSLLQGDSRGIGGYAETRSPEPTIDYVDTNATFLARYIYRIIGAFGVGWDDVKTLLQRSQFIDIVRRKSNTSRQVYISNQQDFFEAFEARYGAGLPSLSCSFGNEWDVDCAVMAEVAARAPRAVEKLRAAEALATLVSLKTPAFLNGREADRDLAFMNLGLFFEHDWAGAPTAQLTTERIAWQKRITGEIEHYVDDLHADAVTALGGLIAGPGATARFFAFNPLSWVRTDIADLPFDGAAPIQVIDVTTSQEVPSQIVTLGGVRTLRVFAADVPPMGYRVYEIRSGGGLDFSAGAPAAAGSQIQNEHYRLTVTGSGAITSLADLGRGGREFVRAGGALNLLGAGSGTLAVENAGPVSVTLRATVTTSDPLKHTTRITLFRGLRRIEIRNTIDQNFDAVATWGFSFDLPDPDCRHEEVGAIVRARLTTAGGQYSPRNARYDWLTLNHFADLSGGGAGVTLSNADCYFFKLGNSTVTTLDTATPSLVVLAGGGVNGYNTIKNQGGPDQNAFLQRFALQTHAGFDAAEAMRFALEHQNPLVTGMVSGGSGYPEDRYAFLGVSDPNVLVWALKPADDGPPAGIVARLWNLAAVPSTVTLTLAPGAIRAAQRVTHIETPLGPATLAGGGLRDTLNAYQLKTYQITQIGERPPDLKDTHLPMVQR